MAPRRLLVLVALLALVLLVTVGGSRASVGGVACPDPVWQAALDGLTEQSPDACESQSMERFYAVAAGLMGLVLITGLLSRRGD